MNSNVTRAPTRAEIDADLELVDYVAGRLSGERRAAFEARLDADPALASRVAEERALSAAISGSQEPVVPGAEAFDRIAHELRPQASRRAAAWPLTAIAASIVAVALVIVVAQSISTDSTGIDEQGRDRFELLSEDGATPASSANRVRVVFAADSTAAERAAAAADLGFDIVSEPGAGGAYVVETPVPVARERLVEWRADARIDLAEPVRFEPEPR